MLIFCQCAKEEEVLTPQQQLDKDIQIIKDYLTANGLTANSTASGLHYIITNPGSGGHPNINSQVTVYYKGYYTDKKVFDQTTFGTPVTFPLSNVIKGWQEGIPLFQKGGYGFLFIPSGLAYGPNPQNGVPANAVMIFEIELVDF